MTPLATATLRPSPGGQAIAIAVKLVGIGFASRVIGAIAQRFIRPTVQEVAMNDAELAKELKDLSAWLQFLERALEQRLSVDHSPG